MSDKILCVDDEANILFGYRRQLRRDFRVETALGADEALKVLENKGPFAVVVSDLQMPGLDGIKFLSRVRVKSPDSVRVMITGHADLDAAMSAVNEGNIFRFLTKPVQPAMLKKTILASLEQYHLVRAERELIEDTLNGSVRVLTEVLSLVNPMAFSRASRINRYVEQIVDKLDLEGKWQFNLASMLSQIGCITLHPETLEKVYAGQELTAEEQEAFFSHPEVGSNLLEKIPRMEGVAGIIALQLQPGDRFDFTKELKERDPVELGGQILKTTLEFDRYVMHGSSKKIALARLRVKAEDYDPVIVEAMEDLELTGTASARKLVKVDELETGMVLDQDVKNNKGVLLVAKGQEVTIFVLKRLHKFASRGEIDESLMVMAPDSHNGSVEKAPLT
jgi:response regulator RpfG family c-di-GMP phosphodiesterase